MPRKKRKPDRMRPRAYAALLDDIKDEIDNLDTIKHNMQRDEAASELLKYINLHFGGHL